MTLGFFAMTRCLIAWLMLGLAATAAPDSATTDFALTGTVLAPEGRPLAGALVSIVSARPRAGESLASPFCYPDCGKHARTDRRGEFAVRAVDPTWLYTVLIEAGDFHPQLLTFDPRSGVAADVRLAVLNDPRCKVLGRVLQSDGRPASGALMTVENVALEGRQVGDHQLPRQVRTDDQGRFLLSGERVLRRVTVTLTGVGTVKEKQFQLVPGAAENVLQLSAGSTISGRVMRQARPVAGAVVGLAGFAPLGGKPVESHEGTTNELGMFTIGGLQPLSDFHLYTRMNAPAGLTAINREIISAGAGETVDVGELNLHPAHWVRGRVVLTDRKPMPRGLCAVLERAQAADVQEAPVDARGDFEFAGVPAETVTLSFRTGEVGNIPGYRLSPQCFSLDYRLRATLCGRVVDDVDLVVLFEPGDMPEYRVGQMRRTLWAQGGAPLVQQRRLELEPLRGVPPELVSRGDP